MNTRYANSSVSGTSSEVLTLYIPKQYVLGILLAGSIRGSPGVISSCNAKVSRENVVDFSFDDSQGVLAVLHLAAGDNGGNNGQIYVAMPGGSPMDGPLYLVLQTFGAGSSFQASCILYCV